MSALPTELYENLLNNLHEGLYIVDREMKITYWNDAAEQITGFSKEQVEQHRCSDNILRHVDADGINLCENGCPLHATIFDRKKTGGIPVSPSQRGLQGSCIGQDFLHHR